MMKNEMFIPCGAGKIHVYAGDAQYGQVLIDLLVERDGKEFAFPIVTVENPVIGTASTEATDGDATSVYVYGDMNDDEYTHKVVIPNSCIDEAMKIYEEI